MNSKASIDDMDAPGPRSVARKRKILAIGSAGGHWIQLMRIVPAFNGHVLVFVSTMNQDVGQRRLHIVRDANRNEKLSVLVLIVHMLAVVLRERPDVVVTTGAAPGYIAVRLARLFRTRTIWIDSFANVDELSMSGRMAGRYSDLWLTQWPHLAKPGGPEFAGNVL